VVERLPDWRVGETPPSLDPDDSETGRMPIQGGGPAELAAEFNQRLGRTDGESVAGVFRELFRQDLAVWLDGRVLPLFQGASWPDRPANESRCRDEVSCFQAVEAANIARDAGYVPADRALWLVDWLLRLNLGTAAGDLAQAGLARYWKQDHVKRVGAFAAAAAAALPEPPCARDLSSVVAPKRFFWDRDRVSPATFFVRTFGPLLVFRSHVTVSMAFDDPTTAAAARAAHDTRDHSLRDACDEFITGGGVNHVLAKGGEWLTTTSDPHGELLVVFTARQAADAACQAIDDSAVVSVSNREMLAQRAAIDRKKIRYIAVITAVAGNEEQEAGVLPIDRFMHVVKTSVDHADSGELARSYRKGVVG
jgi:hypothetical protein